jgi:hypothetical protein
MHSARRLLVTMKLIVVAAALGGPLISVEAQSSAPSQNPSASPKEKQSRFSAAMRNGTNLIDANEGGLFFFGDYANENLDIIARAQASIAVKSASILPPPKEELLSRFALEATRLNDKLGALDEADAYSKLVTDKSSFCGVTNATNLIKELEATGRTREAAILKKSLPEDRRVYRPPFLAAKGESEDQSLRKLQDNFALTRRCLSAIGTGNKAAANSDATKLLANYEAELPPPEWRPIGTITGQNLFCTLLNISRKMSDHGWFAESNALLEKLSAAATIKKDWSTAAEFILIEKVINAGRAKKDSADLWAKLDKAPLFSWQSNRAGKAGNIITVDLSESEKLRLLAIAFYSADELARADILVSQALKTFNPVDTQAAPELKIVHFRKDEEGVAGEQVMLMLTAACIKAAERKFDQANDFIGKALSGPPVAKLGYGGRLAELARLYEENGRNATAIEFLKRARAKNIVPAFRMARHSTSSPYVVDFWLAKLLFDSGKAAEARPIIEDAIAQAVNPIQPPNSREKIPGVSKNGYNYYPFILAGECAVADKDYTQAARRFEQAGLSRQVGSLGVSEKPVLDRLCLQRALTYASKVNTFANDDKAQIYTELAQSYKNKSPQKALEFDKSALDLLEDSNPRRPNLLNEMANLSMQAKYQNDAKAPPGGLPGTEKNSLIENNRPPSQQNNHKLDQIPLLREAAETAERNKESTVYGRYLTLANTETSDLDQAIIDCRHAISLYNGNVAPDFTRLGYSRTAPLNPIIIASTLARTGRTAEGINLMEEAATKVQTLNGLSSREAQEELKALLQFYIDQKNEEKALQSLDRVLLCKMQATQNRDGLDSSPHSDPGFRLDTPYTWAKSVASEKPKLAVAILSKVLAAQRKQLPAGDLKIADTLQTFGDVHVMLNDDKSALSDYQHAYEIIKMYEGDKRAVQRIPAKYFSLMRAAGKNSDADSLERIRNELNQPKLFSTAAVTPVVIQLKQTNEDDVPTLKSEYEQAKKVAPHSYQTQSTLLRLAAAAKRKQDWKLAIACGLQQLDQAKRSGESPEQLAPLQKQLVALSLESADLDSAQTWLNELTKNKRISANDLSGWQKKLIREYIRAGRFGDARKNLQVLWASIETDSTNLYRSEIDLIEALKESGMNKEAKEEIVQLFEKRAKWIAQLKSSNEAILLGKLALEANQKKWLPDLLTKGESLAPSDQGECFFPEFAKLWKEIGNEKQANDLLVRYKKFTDQMVGSQGMCRSLSDLDEDKLSTEQTRTGSEFSPPPAMKSYSCNFAALSSNSLIFDNHARVAVDRTNQVAFAGTYGELKTAQKTDHAGNLSFVSMNVSGIDVPQDSNSVKSDSGTSHKRNIPPVQVLPFKAALEAPANSHNVFLPYMGEGMQLGLGKGDYNANSGVTFDTINVEGTGRVRILIYDETTSGGIAFHLPPRGRVNATIPNGPAKKESWIEIWYNGRATIKLDEDCTFNGIIYAPNAKIEIGPGNANFCGAMVARDIIVTGDSQIFWDPNLANWKEDMELH